MRWVWIVVLAACGRSEERRPKLHPCEALARAANTAKALRDTSAGQISSIELGMQRAKQHADGTVPTDKADIGQFSGASERVYAYRKTGLALCSAADAVREDLLNVAAKLEIPGAKPGENTRCTASMFEEVTTTDAAKRQAAAAALVERARKQGEEERGFVDACYAKYGEDTYRPTQIPGIFATTEI